MKMPEIKNMVAGYMAAVERAACGAVCAGWGQDDCLQDGNFLVIDYREKTLDIAWVTVHGKEKLWQVNREGQLQAEPSRVKVHMIKSSAVDREDAGICTWTDYVQAVLCEALERMHQPANMQPVDMQPVDMQPADMDENFCRAAQELSCRLLLYEPQLWDAFYIYGAEDLNDLASRILTAVTYKHTELPIGLDLLVIIYCRMVNGWLEQTLNDVKNKLKTLAADESFKIIFMGSFGRFALVRQQAAHCFRLTEYDGRAAVLSKQQQDAGCLLLSEQREKGRIEVCFNSPVGLGVYSYDQTGQRLPWYAIWPGQDILEDCPYCIQSEIDHEYFLMFSYSGNISSFLIHSKGCGPGLGILAPEYRKKLTGIIRSDTHTAVLGFSIAHDGAIALHIRNFNAITKKTEGTAQTVVLDGAGDLFENIQYGI